MLAERAFASGNNRIWSLRFDGGDDTPTTRNLHASENFGREGCVAKTVRPSDFRDGIVKIACVHILQSGCILVPLFVTRIGTE